MLYHFTLNPAESQDHIGTVDMYISGPNLKACLEKLKIQCIKDGYIQLNDPTDPTEPLDFNKDMSADRCNVGQMTNADHDNFLQCIERVQLVKEEKYNI